MSKHIPQPLLTGLTGFCILAASASGPQSILASQVLELDNEVVCRVNTDVVSKRDIENRMISSGKEVVLKIFMRREQAKSEGRWNEQAQKEFEQLYSPLFIDELRETVKETLMKQEAEHSKEIKVNEQELENEVKRQVAFFQKEGAFGKPGYKTHEIRERTRERLLLKTFRDNLINVLDLPTRPKIQAHYESNIAQYQRKAAAKVRIVQINRLVTDASGNLTVREDAREAAERLRKEIMEFGASFEDVARDRSDGEASVKKRGGLLMTKEGDDYIIPEDQTGSLANQIRGTKVKGVSPVFDLNEQTLAFICVEDARPAGPRPLDRALFEEIHKELLDFTAQRREEDWFRAALRRSLILDGNGQPLPLALFVPNDKSVAKEGSQDGAGFRIKMKPE